MGYNKSKKVLEEVRPLLDIVLKIDNTRIAFPSKNPTKLAMSIREGLKSAEDDEEESKYSEILKKFKLRVKPDKIIFDPRIQLTYENPVIELANSINALEIPKVTTILQVIGACLKHKAPRIIFPDVPVWSEDDWTPLNKWLMKNNYEIESKNPLILIKTNGRPNESSSNSRQENDLLEQG